MLSVLAAGALRAEPPRVLFTADGERTVVEVRGLEPDRLAELRRTPPADWTRLLMVHTEEASLAPGLPPLMGSYSIEADAIRFTPRFPLASGVPYVASWHDPNAAGEPVGARFEQSRAELPPSTTLTGIFPSGAQVPENLLRIYLQFSAPMSQGRAHDHIRLLDEWGDPVDGPFVAPERELWSPDGTRLTLFFDPGRIKRGVGPNAEVGPPLRAGASYRLEVDHEIPDARGVPLVRDYFKELSVVPPDREQPRTEEWRLTPPESPTAEVRLDFPEPLDHGLLHGLLVVLDASDMAVEGRTTVHPGEIAWSFEPHNGWGKGIYRIRVATLLEDLAGNSLERPFEVVLDSADWDADDGPRYMDLTFGLPSRRP